MGAAKAPKSTHRVHGQFQFLQTCPDLLDAQTVCDMMMRVGESANMVKVDEHALALVDSLRPTQHLQHGSANRIAPLPIFHDDPAPVGWV